jgi:hypothetical protein
MSRLSQSRTDQDQLDRIELRQTIRTAGGFSSETHWWQGPCICPKCDCESAFITDQGNYWTDYLCKSCGYKWSEESDRG